MATFTFQLQGTTPTTIEATDIIQFAGAGGFDSKITAGQYNDSTHVESSVGANDSSANAPKNNKYISATEVDIGAGTVLLSSLTDADAALKINFSDPSAVATESASFYAYDGVTTTAVPTGVTFQAAEIGDTNWTNAEGSAAALSLADQAAATSHDFFIAISASPESVGLKDAFSLRVELTYS